MNSPEGVEPRDSPLRARRGRGAGLAGNDALLGKSMLSHIFDLGSRDGCIHTISTLYEKVRFRILLLPKLVTWNGFGFWQIHAQSSSEGTAGNQFLNFFLLVNG